MNRELALAWAAELESGHHRQGTDRLCNPDGAKCCLGVAMWMTPNIKAKLDERHPRMNFGHTGNYLIWADLSHEAMEFFGIYSAQGNRRDDGDIVIDGVGYRNLANANDAHVPFDRIAAYIRENWEVL